MIDETVTGFAIRSHKLIRNGNLYVKENGTSDLININDNSHGSKTAKITKR